MRYREIITEGLIAIPPKMLKEANFYLTFYMLWWARDRFKGKTKELPEQYAAFKKLVREFGEKIPENAFRPQKNISLQKIKVDLDGLPKNYQNLQPNTTHIWFCIDWLNPTKNQGCWIPSKNTLEIFPFGLDYIINYPSQRSDPDDLQLSLETMRETISHELRHMTQSVLMHKHPEQVKKKKKYSQYRNDYFTSPIEFDPQIGSSVHDFLQLWKTYKEAKKDKGISLLSAARQYIGITPSRKFDTFTIDRFFKYLKADTPVRYKLGVKKFIQELERQT